jgi:transposase
MTGPGETKSPPAVWYAYTPDRKGEHPQSHLKEFRGTLQADAYAGYGAVYEGKRVKEAACMAHVRGPFYELYEAHRWKLTARNIDDCRSSKHLIWWL